MNDASPRLHVNLLAHQLYQDKHNIALHFSQPLVAEDGFFDLRPSLHALDHLSECTPLMQHILRKLLDRAPLGVYRVIILPSFLIIDHDALLTVGRLSDIFKEAAMQENMTYEAHLDLP